MILPRGKIQGASREIIRIGISPENAPWFIQKDMQKDQLHPIGYVAYRTGLTPHVIRAWEKRYQAVQPSRTATNRRLYSEADIEKLRLLRTAVSKGHRISQLAALSVESLLMLLIEEGKRAESRTLIEPFKGESPEAHYNACLNAILQLDQKALDLALNRAAIELTRLSLLERVIGPLVQEIGELWYQGRLKVMHEHMATSTIRSFLGDILRTVEPPPRAPKIIITTPPGQWHEVGALILALVASDEGWRVIYLGASLPTEEIVAAAEMTKAKAVALSIVYPSDDPSLARELSKLRRYLAEDIALIAGGRAAGSYEETLRGIGAVMLKDIAAFRSQLESLRSGKRGNTDGETGSLQ
jgi:methanogenic corrinoid protein MtbC1